MSLSQLLFKLMCDSEQKYLWGIVWLLTAGSRGSRAAASEREDGAGRPGNVWGGQSRVERRLGWEGAGQWGRTNVSAAAGLQDDIHPPGGSVQVWSGHHTVGWEVSCRVGATSGVMRNFVGWHRPLNCSVETLCYFQIARNHSQESSHGRFKRTNGA